MPPCGAISVQPNRADRKPATPAPTIVHGITCAGSAAANGIAPSVMKEHPITIFDTAEPLSAFVNFFGKSQQAAAIPMGGTIPPIIMAAMEIKHAWTAGSEAWAPSVIICAAVASIPLPNT